MRKEPPRALRTAETTERKWNYFLLRALRAISALLAVVFLLPGCGKTAPTAQADLILHNGRIVTVDKDFSIHQAIAIKDGRILETGDDRRILKYKSTTTHLVDLHHQMVLPGLMDSHTHPTSAAMTEFDHPIPEMESIQDVLNYIRDRAATLGPGKWINLSQIFITRLREQRYPTREELDRAAPENPVLFATGPDASLNSLAMKLSGIDKEFKVADGSGGFAEKDPATGEPTGILRNATRYVKSQRAEKEASESERYQRVIQLFHDYNSVGITSIGDRNAGADDVKRYQRILKNNQLTLRISISRHIDTIGPMEGIQNRIRDVGKDPLHKPDPMLQIIGIKTFLDGGMLTGSAFMREPWGISKIYAITDPNYRGVLFIPRERLIQIVRTCFENNLQFTAHSVGDGAVHTLLDVYDQLNNEKPIQQNRPCITHSNFMSLEAIQLAAKLGVCLDIQPAWLYLDTRTLVNHFGLDRLRYFQPLHTIFEHHVIVGGGSDHMQKIGSLRSINPYNPFLAMQTAISRRARRYDGQLHPEEALTREQAIRFYTINNAWLLFRESDTGSLEKGKRADLIILDRDLLRCPEDQISSTQVLQTWLDGKMVYDAQSPNSP